MLVEHGAEATTKAKDGTTPLHQASQMGFLNVARFLVNVVKYGADGCVSPG
jgi:ankyrin repeat protein